MYTLKKGVMVLAVVFIMLLSGFFGRSLMYVMAEEEADTRPEKYYTSIHLKMEIRSGALLRHIVQIRRSQLKNMYGAAPDEQSFG